MRYLWLNLDRHTNRADYTRKMLSGKNHERVKAEVYPFPNGFANRAFYGNYLSHMSMIDRARHEPTILMEDDLIINWRELEQAYDEFMQSDAAIANFVPWLSMACYAVKPDKTDQVLAWLEHNKRNNVESNRHLVKYSSIDCILFDTFGQPFKTQWSPVCTTQPRHLFGSASYCMTPFRFCGSPWLDLKNGLALIFTEKRVAWSRNKIGGYGTWRTENFTAAGGNPEDSPGTIRLSGVPDCDRLNFDVPPRLTSCQYSFVYAEQPDYDQWHDKYGPLVFTQPYENNHGLFNYFFGGQPNHGCGLEQSAGKSKLLDTPPVQAPVAVYSW